MSAGNSSLRPKSGVSYHDDKGIDAELLEELKDVKAQREEPLIEKILARRADGNGGARKNEAKDAKETEKEGPFEYLVKWRGKSYLHVDWIEEDLVLQDIDGGRRLRAFNKLQQENGPVVRESRETKRRRKHEEDLGQFFDPSFIEVERIVDASHMEDEKKVPEQVSAEKSQAWVREAQQLLAQLISYRVNKALLSVYFMELVDEELDGAPGYYNVVKEGMSFNLIRDRLMSGTFYQEVGDFAKDVRLIFENCRLYNPNPELYVRFCGDNLSQLFEKKYAAMLTGRKNLEAAQDTRKFLVKWKGLSYADMSWENESDILDDSAIAAYYRRSRIPTIQTKDEMNGQAMRPFIKYTTSPSFKNGLQLRSYQLEGLNWLAFNHANNRGSILADEMGLGKTCQTVAFVSHLYSQGYLQTKPALVVAPLSTLGHWKNEFDRWSDLNAILYHDQGSRRMTGGQARKIIRDVEFYFWKKHSKKGTRKFIPGLFKFHVLITSYESLVSDASDLSGIPFAAVIVDEGHRLKSKKGKLAMAFRDSLKTDCRIILTGTPLQNNIEELFNLLHFIEPREFASKDEFLGQFGDLQNAEQVQVLQNRVKPYMLRRLKEHVEKDIPAKEETVIDVELTMMQKKYYRAIFERNREFLSGSAQGSSSRALPPQLSNIEMELRKCCNHPYLINGVEEKETASFATPSDALKGLIQASGKMVLLDKLLAKLRNESRKVLIFSQFKIMLDIIEDYCHHPDRSFPVERIDGNTSGNARQKAIDRYCDPTGNSFVFLLSTRAGGVGINLTAADTVIIFDSDWNPQNDLQAMARCHRIGQKNNVKVYRFVTKNTYESHLFDRAARKLGLEQAVLGRQGSTSVESGPPTQTKEEIEELLRFGAYRLLENDDEAAEKSRQFSETNIDDLLARDSRKVTWDKSTDGSNGSAGTSNNFSFSKASFVAAGTDEEIDVSDPKFWTKVLGEDPRRTMLSRLLDGSAYQTNLSKTKFFDELRAAGNQVIQEKLSGIVKPEFEEQVLQCLEHISNAKRTFTEDEQAAASHFMRQVERPSRRHNAQGNEFRRFYENEAIVGVSEEVGPKDNKPSIETSSVFGNDSEVDDDSDGTPNRRKRDEKRKKKRTVEVDGRVMDMCQIQNSWIEPDDLKKAIDAAGGYEKVVQDRNWTEVRENLGLEASSSVNFSIHRVFKKYFIADPSAIKVFDRGSKQTKEKSKANKKAKSSSSEEDGEEESPDESTGEDDESEGAKRTNRTRKRASTSRGKSRQKTKSGKSPASSKKPQIPTRPKLEWEITHLDPSVYVEKKKNGEPWCRYCGAVESSGFSRGPWGTKTLCVVHYVEWFQKRTLNLKDYKDDPDQPINPDVNTQFKYMAFKKDQEDKNLKTAENLNVLADAADDAKEEEEQVEELNASGRPRRRASMAVSARVPEKSRNKKSSRNSEEEEEVDNDEEDFAVSKKRKSISSKSSKKSSSKRRRSSPRRESKQEVDVDSEEEDEQEVKTSNRTSSRKSARSTKRRR